MQLPRAYFALVFLVLVPGALPLVGQTTGHTVAQTAASETAPTSPPPGTPKIENGTSNDRLLFALPNFQSVEDVGKLPPLTEGQKYKLVVRSAFDPVQYPWYAMLAGIGQATNSESSYGQGAEGYGKRYGLVFADGIMENFMVGAILPSALHQDPRFYQTSKGSFMHRLGYAMSRVVVTRSDSGKEQFNYSEILGSSMTAVFGGYTYHPRQDHNIGNVATVWVTQLSYDTLSYVTREFWPDIRRKIVGHRHQATGP
jgi:hypothetical protein